MTFANDDPKHGTVNILRGIGAPLPHIYFCEGLWRVSPWNRRPRDLDRWCDANQFAARLNGPLLDARFGRACPL